MRRKVTNNFIKVQIILILANFICLEAKVSDQRLCADPNCSVLLGVGKTVLKYFAKDNGMLSFANNKPVKIFSKGAGSNPDLWGVMIDGRRGYVNKAHVQEQRVYRKDLEFNVPTEFSEGAIEEVKVEEKKPEEENVPFQAEIQKSEQLEDIHIETKQPELKPSVSVEIPVAEVVSSFSASVESHSVEISAISTPPIQSSNPPPTQQSSVAPQPVEPNSIVDYEVVDGTTIYFDDPPPKINEAPSMENVTPEAISPTMTEARAKPTESSKTPEIESSVSEHLDVVEQVGTAVLSDNPGGSAPTVNAKDVTHKSLDATEPITEEIRTVAYDLGSKDQEKNHPGDMADKIQVDKPIVEGNIPFTVHEEEEESDSQEEDYENEDERFTIDSENEETDDEEDDYIEEPSNEEKMKLQKKIEEMKMQPIEELEALPEVSEEIDLDNSLSVGDSDDKIKETENSELKTTNSENENVISEEIPFSVIGEPEVIPTTQSPDTTTESIEKFTVESDTINVVEPTPGQTVQDIEVDSIPIDTNKEIYSANTENPEIYSSDNNQSTKQETGEEAKLAVQEHSTNSEYSQGHAHGHDHAQHSHHVDNGNEHNHDNHEPSHDANHGHGHGHSHGHQGHSHEHHGHSQEQHGHSHDHHGHSHDHDHHGHDHSHGMGHLGQGIKQRVPEKIPEYYKPAEQKFDLPLSAQFGSPSSYSEPGQYTTPPPVVQPYHQYENTQVTQNASDAADHADLTDTPANALDMNTSEQVITQKEEIHTFTEANNDQPVTPPTVNTLENDAYQTQPPPGTFDVESNTPALETTQSPDIEIEAIQSSDNDVETNQYEKTPTEDTSADGTQYTDTDAINTKISKPEPAVEESGGLFARIASFFSSSSTPDKALQDAMNTPPDIEVKVKGQETGEYVSSNQNADIINQVEYVQSANLEDGSTTPSPDLVNLSVDENKNDPTHDSQIMNFQNPGNDQLATKDSSEIYQIPEWLTVFVHDQGFVNSDRLALVGIIAITLLFLHFINTFMDRGTREKPLIRKIAEMDRKLFTSSNELLILKKEMSENEGTSVDSGANSQVVREMELQLEQSRLELETSRETVQKEGERYNMTVSQLELSRQDVSTAQEEARQAQEMVEEMLANQKDKNSGADDKLLEVVQQLQTQLESQKNMLQKYEPKLKKKEKENRELTKELKQMRADVANANLETDKFKKELTETSKIKDDSASKLAEITKNEDEWKSLTDLLQSQLNEKSETLVNMETEMSSLRSRISIFKNESESKEEQLEILQETLDELQNRKSNKVNGNEINKSDETDGWEVEEEGWEVDEVNEIKEVAKLRIENRKTSELKEILEKEVTEVNSKLEIASVDLEKYKNEATSLREARDEVLNDRTDVQRRLDVLTEFFNKKEAELQKQLGLQSARFGDVSTDAESTARQLISVTSELDSTQEQLKIIKSELEDQERSLKASVAGQEKKAHENWVAARQAERKLTELQGEMSLMRNKLTMVESKNTLLEQEKEDLTGTVNMLTTAVKSEPVTTNGVHTSGSLDSLSLGQGDIHGSGPNSITGSSFPTSPTGPESLPPLPGLPGISSLGSVLPPSMPGMTGMPLLANPLGMVPPLFQAGSMLPGIPPMLEMRQPPLGRMSPGPRDRSNRSFSSRSPSPEYERYRGGLGRPYSNRDRDTSPSSRSERRMSPTRRGPSPTRSERNFRDRQYQPDYNRDRDRYYNRGNRDTSPDRYSTRSEQSERESPRENHRYREDRNRTGPKTSTPSDPQGRSYRA
eukprot:GFUD01027382.1.p1 GENE.GFUD01027382.1~~GFUD01027382.1.p1  ORF type:complete len:1768 (+),score=522.48 GFUD01027382.1:102-5405(+)